jgi:hypothetical protein
VVARGEAESEEWWWWPWSRVGLQVTAADDGGMARRIEEVEAWSPSCSREKPSGVSRCQEERGNRLEVERILVTQPPPPHSTGWIWPPASKLWRASPHLTMGTSKRRTVRCCVRPDRHHGRSHHGYCRREGGRRVGVVTVAGWRGTLTKGRE